MEILKSIFGGEENIQYYELTDEDWENIHAHKTWFIRHNGVNYHYYCAVNSENERFIALATSE